MQRLAEWEALEAANKMWLQADAAHVIEFKRVHAADGVLLSGRALLRAHLSAEWREAAAPDARLPHASDVPHCAVAVAFEQDVGEGEEDKAVMSADGMAQMERCSRWELSM